MAFDIASASFSECGRRERNEDAYADIRSQDGRLRAFAVADGLGGHDRGEVASATAVAAARACVERGRDDGDLSALIADVFASANAAIASAREHMPQSNLATTLAFAATDGTSIAWGHCGDTRIYRLRAGLLERLTRDHTFEGSLEAIGASRHGGVEHSMNLLAALDGRALVFEPSPPPQPLSEDDAFLLCSDGVWAGISEREFVAAANSAGELATWLDALRDAIVRADDPEQDNATALGFTLGRGRLSMQARKERTMLRRIFGR